MNYTLEDIYELVGKKDLVAGISFKQNSETFIEFGPFLTVVFLYTQKEREFMDDLILKKSRKNHGYLKAKYLGSDLEKEKVALLLERGVRSEDIIEVLYINNANSNTFHSNTKRNIDKLYIPIQVDTEGEAYIRIYLLKKNELKLNIGLSPEEKLFQLAGKLIYEPNKLTIEDKKEIFQKNGIIDVNIEWELLKLKYHLKEMSNEERSRLSFLYRIRKKERIKQLMNHLQNAGISLQKLKAKNSDLSSKLIQKVIAFKEVRLTQMSEHPIFIDLESYLHIYIRHVEEYQVSSHFKKKDNFQWNEEDVVTVIKKIIRSEEKEYEAFRKSNPNKRYSKYGDYSKYFEGDYYTFHIESNGRISTFYKNKKNIS